MDAVARSVGRALGREARRRQDQITGLVAKRPETPGSICEVGRPGETFDLASLDQRYRRIGLGCGHVRPSDAAQDLKGAEAVECGVVGVDHEDVAQRMAGKSPSERGRLGQRHREAV